MSNTPKPTTATNLLIPPDALKGIQLATYVEPVTAPTQPVTKKLIPVKVGRETAHRRGKGVTTVFDTPLNDDQLKELCTTLKNRCGTGGTVKDGVIEIQGDQRDRIMAELEKLGYKPKRVGG